jgi:hypothetical protein
MKTKLPPGDYNIHVVTSGKDKTYMVVVGGPWSGTLVEVYTKVIYPTEDDVEFKKHYKGEMWEEK